MAAKGMAAKWGEHANEAEVSNHFFLPIFSFLSILVLIRMVCVHAGCNGGKELPAPLQSRAVGRQVCENYWNSRWLQSLILTCLFCREIRKLIAHFQQNGGAARKMNYGTLFEQTAQTFEALSGTLVAAKKRGVCSMLFASSTLLLRWAELPLCFRS
jgi:hypothetical protein